MREPRQWYRVTQMLDSLRTAWLAAPSYEKICHSAGGRRRARNLANVIAIKTVITLITQCNANSGLVLRLAWRWPSSSMAPRSSSVTKCMVRVHAAAKAGQGWGSCKDEIISTPHTHVTVERVGDQTDWRSTRVCEDDGWVRGGSAADDSTSRCSFSFQVLPLLVLLAGYCDTSTRRNCKCYLKTGQRRWSSRPIKIIFRRELKTIQQANVLSWHQERMLSRFISRSISRKQA